MSAPTLRILIVDDNADAAEMFGAMMELSGYQTRVALDGPGGLQAAREFRPDVIFLDLGMPGMDGFAVARALAADASLSRCAVVAVTGWGSTEDKRKTREAGFRFHVTKPVKKPALDQLLALVAAELESSGSESVNL